MKGIVIHSLAYGDHSRIAHILLEQVGLKSFIIRTGKGKKNQHSHLLSPLHLVDIEVHLRENIQIHSPTNLTSACSFREIPFDPVKSSIALFCCEVLHKTLHADYANADLFRFVWESIMRLDQEELPANFPIYFLIGICTQYGFDLHDDDAEVLYFDLSTGSISSDIPSLPTELNREQCRILALLVRQPNSFQEVLAHHLDRKQIIDTLILYLKLHLDSRFEIRSAEVLHEVFTD